MTTLGFSAIPTHTSDFACIDFVNSAFTDYLGNEQPRDRLPLAAWQAWFLERHGLELRRRRRVPTQHLQTFREDLRSILERWGQASEVSRGDANALDRWVRFTDVHQRAIKTGGRLELTIEPDVADWDWVVARVAASAVELIATSDPDRLRTCGNPQCSWMFYDGTLNGSKRYCSANLCANIMRVRRFRKTASR